MDGDEIEKGKRKPKVKCSDGNYGCLCHQSSVETEKVKPGEWQVWYAKSNGTKI